MDLTEIKEEVITSKKSNNNDTCNELKTIKYKSILSELTL